MDIGSKTIREWEANKEVALLAVAVGLGAWLGVQVHKRFDVVTENEVRSSEQATDIYLGAALELEASRRRRFEMELLHS